MRGNEYTTYLWAQMEIFWKKKKEEEKKKKRGAFLLQIKSWSETKPPR